MALSGKLNKKKCILFFVSFILTVIVWNLPSTFFGIDGLTTVQQRVIAIFVMAVMLWLTEAIPAWATSVTIIFVLLFFVSNSSFKFMQGSEGQYGQLLDSVGIMACFADPTIILFLGGFILAIAATKSGLDVWMAKVMIKPFGKKSENVLLGFMLITGIFSMFISNTATAAMMLTFLTPVFKVLNDPTGMNLDISFGHWMAVMVPLVIVLLIIAWFLLRKLFPFSQKTIELHIEGDVKHNWRSVVVGATFFVTIVLWIFGKQIGINANTVAMLPIAVFAFSGVISAKDLQQIDWGVIWMVAGGFALGLAMNGTGLAKVAVESIPFGSWSPIVILIISGLVCYFLSNFISNTATAALLIPILSVVCSGMGDKLNIIGGDPTILVGIAVAASAAMSLPISTPPNAIAYSTGLINQKDMAKTGITVGVITLALGFSMLIVIGKCGLL